MIQLVYSSCTDSHGTCDEFIKDGDIVYRSVPKELVGFSGDKAALLTWKLTNPFLVTKCIISDDDMILAEIPVEYKDSLEFSYKLENLEEKTYTFSVYSMDEDGNQSIKKDVIVEVFGEKYKSQLKTTRTITDVVKAEDNSVCVYLNKIVSTKNVATNVIYVDNSGETKVKEVGEVDHVILDNVKSDSDFMLEDLWLPTNTTFEKFKAPYKTYTKADFPHLSKRTIEDVYRDSDNKVYIRLTSSVEYVYKSFISYGEKSVEVLPSENLVVLEDLPFEGNLSLVTAIQPEGEGSKLFYTDEYLCDMSIIPDK